MVETTVNSNIFMQVNGCQELETKILDYCDKSSLLAIRETSKGSLKTVTKFNPDFLSQNNCLRYPNLNPISEKFFEVITIFENLFARELYESLTKSEKEEIPKSHILNYLRNSIRIPRFSTQGLHATNSLLHSCNNRPIISQQLTDFLASSNDYLGRGDHKTACLLANEAFSNIIIANRSSVDQYVQEIMQSDYTIELKILFLKVGLNLKNQYIFEADARLYQRAFSAAVLEISATNANKEPLTQDSDLLTALTALIIQKDNPQVQNIAALAIANMADPANNSLALATNQNLVSSLSILMQQKDNPQGQECRSCY